MMFDKGESSFNQAPGSAGMVVEEPGGYAAVTISSVEEAMEILRSANRESSKKSKKEKEKKVRKKEAKKSSSLEGGKRPCLQTARMTK